MTDAMKLADAVTLGRRNERDDVLALLRKMADDPGEDEAWSRWAEQLAEVLEGGKHEGYAAFVAVQEAE